MSKQDLQPYKSRLKEYLNKKGINIEKTDAERIQCPGHDDQKPSAIVYDEILFCPVCDTKIDIFEVAALYDNLSTFPEKINAVKSVLGESTAEYTAPAPKTAKKGDQKSTQMVPLSHDKALKEFTREKFLKISEFVGKGDPSKGYGNIIPDPGVWAYRNESGDVELIDVRFEGGPKKKNVVSFYWNGKNVKASKPPVCVYNRHLLSKYPDHTILIVEGCKTAQEAEKLIPFGFLPMTWNGGTAKVTMADWSCLTDRNVCFLPDDDEPGMKAAIKFRKDHKTKIIQPYAPARKIKKSGADIVEILQLISPEDLAKYINENEYIEPSPSPPNPLGTQSPPQALDGDGSLFKVLGIAENEHAYFISTQGRLSHFKLDTISDKKLMTIAPLGYWEHTRQISKISKDEWIHIFDDVIQLSSTRDFSLDFIRGRGAWREKDGRLCFHDGINTIGEYDDNKIFRKKAKIDIGIGSKPVSQEILDKMKTAAFSLSFETRVDAIRLLAWAILSPFSGALIWRPQAFLTGESGSGKSSVEMYIVTPLSIPDRFNAGKTSAPGYLQNRNKDSGSVIFDEAEKDNETKKKYVNDMLSIMRQSTSDDTPKSAMGTSDQTGTTYQTRDMFLFLAIDPTVESNADDNRLTKINMITPTDKIPWNEKKQTLIDIFTKENCRSVRSMTWGALPKIIALSEPIAESIQNRTSKDHRFAISEAILISAYMVIWRGNANPTTKEIDDFVHKNYELKGVEEDRNDTEEIIDKILQYRVKVHLSRVKEYNVLEVLQIIKSETHYTGGDLADKEGYETISDKAIIQEYKRSINNYGISLDLNHHLAIANKHGGIRHIIDRSHGYSKILKRHKDFVTNNKNVAFTDKKQYKCTIIKNILEDSVIPF